jgi:hypothetical protein
LAQARRPKEVAWKQSYLFGQFELAAMLRKSGLVLACLLCPGNARHIHSQQTLVEHDPLQELAGPESGRPSIGFSDLPARRPVQKKNELAALLLTLAPVSGSGVSPCRSPSRRSALAPDTISSRLARRRARDVKLTISQRREDVAKSPANWFEGLQQKMQGSGRAAFASLVAETVLFWIVFLIPAAVFLYHQNTGIWMPDRSDPEAWASFMSILGGCYVFCKIPPIEAARWAWVFAWTPWFQEKLFSGDVPEMIETISEVSGAISEVSDIM